MPRKWLTRSRGRGEDALSEVHRRLGIDDGLRSFRLADLLGECYEHEAIDIYCEHHGRTLGGRLQQHSI